MRLFLCDLACSVGTSFTRKLVLQHPCYSRLYHHMSTSSYSSGTKPLKARLTDMAMALEMQMR
jgi:hypothetical protein